MAVKDNTVELTIKARDEFRVTFNNALDTVKKLGASQQELEKKLKKSASGFSELQEELEKLSGADKGITQLARKLDTLIKARSRLEQLKNVAKGAQAELERLGKTDPGKNQKGIDKLARDIKKAEKALNSANNAVSTQETKIRSLSTTLEGAGVQTRDLSAAQQQLARISSQSAEQQQRLEKALHSRAGATQRVIASNQRLIQDSRKALSVTQRLRGQVLSLVSAYFGLFGAVNEVQRIFGVSSNLQQTINRLNVAFSGDKTAAAEELERLRDLSGALKINFLSLSEEYSRFAAGVLPGGQLTLDETRGLFEAISIQARVLGTSTDDLRGIFKALIQIFSKGKIQAEELRGQIGDRAVGALTDFANGLGISTEKLNKLMEEGKLGSELLLFYGREIKRKYGDQLADAIETPAATVVDFENALAGLREEVGKSGFLNDLVAALKDVTQQLKDPQTKASLIELSKVVGQFIRSLPRLVENWKLFAAVLGSLAAGGLIAYTLQGMKALAGLFTFVGNGAVAAAGAIAKFTGAAAILASSPLVPWLATLVKGLIRFAGPVGIIWTAYEALKFVKDQFWDTSEAIADTTEKLNKNSEAIESNNQKQLDNLNVKLNKKKAKLERLEGRREKVKESEFLDNQIEKTKRQIKLIEKMITEVNGEFVDQLGKLTAQLDKQNEQLDKLNARRSNASDRGRSQGVIDLIDKRIESLKKEREQTKSAIASLSKGFNFTPDTLNNNERDALLKGLSDTEVKKIENDIKRLELKTAELKEKTLQQQVDGVEKKFADQIKDLNEGIKLAESANTARGDRRAAEFRKQLELITKAIKTEQDFIRGETQKILSDEVDKVKEQVAAATVSSFDLLSDEKFQQALEAASQAVQIKYRDLIRKLKEIGDSEGQALVKQLIDLETEKDKSKLTVKREQLLNVRVREVNQGYQARRELTEAIFQIEDRGGSGAHLENLKLQLDSTNLKLLENIASIEKMLETYSGPGKDKAVAAINQIKTGLADGDKTTKQFEISASKLNTDLATGLGDAFVDFATGVSSAKDAFRNFAAQFLAQIARMIAQQMIFNAISGGSPGGAGGAGGLLSSALNHSGGIVGHSGTRRTVPASLFANAVPYHTGGIAGLKPNEVPTILEKGEEVLTANDPRHRNNSGINPNINMKNVNVFDPAGLADEMMKTPEGEKVFVNFIRRNKRMIQGVMN